MNRLRCSVPANLLLFGEYAVLERGGLGIASAISPRLYATLHPARAFTLTSITGERPITIDEARMNAPSLSQSAEERFLCSVLSALLSRIARRSIRAHTIPHIPPVSIAIDARAFYTTNGAKIGLGSSAATTVALCALLGNIDTRDGRLRERRIETRAIFANALATHRLCCGGGSGYDVAVSTFGGTLLFRGGRVPRIRAQKCPWSDGSVGLLRGTTGSDSTDAVARYRTWKGAHRKKWRMFLAQSNRIVSYIMNAKSGPDVVAAINLSRDLQIRIGDEIGVSASFPPPLLPATPTDASAEEGGGGMMTEWPRIPYRTVGAGNELAIAFYPSLNEAESPMQVESEGVRWEQ